MIRRRPQSNFCSLTTHVEAFNFVGNFEHLEAHAQLLLKGVGIWDEFGSNGWGLDHNKSMVQRNQAKHQTGSSSTKIADFLPANSDLRRIAYGYYKADFEFFKSIRVPPFDASRYAQSAETWGTFD